MIEIMLNKQKREKNRIVLKHGWNDRSKMRIKATGMSGETAKIQPKKKFLLCSCFFFCAPCAPLYIEYFVACCYLLMRDQKIRPLIFGSVRRMHTHSNIYTVVLFSSCVDVWLNGRHLSRLQTFIRYFSAHFRFHLNVVEHCTRKHNLKHVKCN